MNGWDTMMLMLDVIDWLADPAKHFLLAFTAGALVYLLTSTTSYALLSVLERGTHRQTSSGAVFGIHICCLLLGVSVALLSHYGLDYLHWWYTKPIDPPLDLVIR